MCYDILVVDIWDSTGGSIGVFCLTNKLQFDVSEKAAIYSVTCEMDKYSIMILWLCAVKTVSVTAFSASDYTKHSACSSYFREQLHLQCSYMTVITVMPLESYGISDHRHCDCLFNSVFRLTTKQTWKPHIAGLLWGESVNGCDLALASDRIHWWPSGFPSQRVSNVESIVMISCLRVDHLILAVPAILMAGSAITQALCCGVLSQYYVCQWHRSILGWWMRRCTLKASPVLMHTGSTPVFDCCLESAFPS